MNIFTKLNNKLFKKKALVKDFPSTKYTAYFESIIGATGEWKIRFYDRATSTVVKEITGMSKSREQAMIDSQHATAGAMRDFVKVN